jgi:hypothetical protein
MPESGTTKDDNGADHQHVAHLTPRRERIIND